MALTMRLQNTFLTSLSQEMDIVYVPYNIDTEWLIQFSCDNIALLKATVDIQLFILHYTEIVHCTVWQKALYNRATGLQS